MKHLHDDIIIFKKDIHLAYLLLLLVSLGAYPSKRNTQTIREHIEWLQQGNHLHRIHI